MSETGPHPDAAPLSGVHRLLDRPLAETDLLAGAEWAARPLEARAGTRIGLLVFNLGDETVAIPAKLLRRVSPFARPIPIPHRTGGLLRGLCNIRGELVLCADLHRALGLPEGPLQKPEGDSDSRRMVVIGPPDASWVFQVERVVGVERAAPSGFRPPPVTVRYALADFTAGVADVRGDQVTVLDGERVLNAFKAGLA